MTVNLLKNLDGVTEITLWGLVWKPQILKSVKFSNFISTFPDSVNTEHLRMALDPMAC